MGEITYQGGPPFDLPMARAASVRVAHGLVEMIVYARVHGKGPNDFPVRILMHPEDALQLVVDLRRNVTHAEEQLRG
jgi:hypothetical protein